MKKCFTVFLPLAGLMGSLHAQTTGKIAGKIIDENTKEPLIGVNVVIEGTPMGSATDMDGRYFVLNIPPGVYNVRYMIIGYTTKIIEGANVNVNRTTTLDVTMQETALLGEEVVVTADRVAVKKDQTSSIRNVTSQDIDILPLESTGAV